MMRNRTKIIIIIIGRQIYSFDFDGFTSSVYAYKVENVLAQRHMNGFTFYLRCRNGWATKDAEKERPNERKSNIHVL